MYILTIRFSKQLFFTGLLRHGSTRALALDTLPIPKWACRAMMICYPPKSMVLGKVSHCFSMMPGAKAPFFLTAHTTGGPHKVPKNGYFTAHTTMAQDGTSSMDDAALVNFLARGLLLWTHDVMEQLPHRLRVQVNRDMFLGAFNYYDDDGNLIDLMPWPMAPVDDVNTRYDHVHVEVQENMLLGVYDRMAACIPGIPSKIIRGEYVTNRGSKTRPSSESVFLSVLSIPFLTLCALYLTAYKLPTKRLTDLPPYDELRPQPDAPRATRSKRNRVSMLVDQDYLGVDHDIDLGVERMLRSKRRNTGGQEEGEEKTTLRRSPRQGTKSRVVYSR